MTIFTKHTKEDSEKEEENNNPFGNDGDTVLRRNFKFYSSSFTCFWNKICWSFIDGEVSRRFTHADKNF